MKKSLSQIARESRPVNITRELPVRELTPGECRMLKVHCHNASPERHKAYLLRASGEDWSVYFNATEASKIQAWIEAEQLPVR